MMHVIKLFYIDIVIRFKSELWLNAKSDLFDKWLIYWIKNDLGGVLLWLRTNIHSNLFLCIIHNYFYSCTTDCNRFILIKTIDSSRNFCFFFVFVKGIIFCDEEVWGPWRFQYNLEIRSSTWWDCVTLCDQKYFHFNSTNLKNTPRTKIENL